MKTTAPPCTIDPAPPALRISDDEMTGVALIVMPPEPDVRLALVAVNTPVSVMPLVALLALNVKVEAELVPRLTIPALVSDT